MGKKQLHPERVMMALMGLLLTTFMALRTAGYFTGHGALKRWAAIVAGITVTIACVPLIAVLVTEGIDWFRKKRHD